jgi:hypothetical protein
MITYIVEKEKEIKNIQSDSDSDSKSKQKEVEQVNKTISDFFLKEIINMK